MSGKTSTDTAEQSQDGNGETGPPRRLLRRPTTAETERIARDCPSEALTVQVFDRYHIVTAEDQRRAMARVEAKAAAADNVVSITQPVQRTRGRAGSGR